VKQQEEKERITAADGNISKLSPAKNWWMNQSGMGSDDTTVSSHSVVSNLTHGTGISSISSAANERRKQRRTPQKGSSSTNELRVSTSSNNSHESGVPKTVSTPRRTNTTFSAKSPNTQKSFNGKDTTGTVNSDSSTSTVISDSSTSTTRSPIRRITTSANNKQASNNVVKLVEERNQLQKQAKLFQQRMNAANEAKNTAEKEKNEAISVMEDQIESLQDKLREVTEKMSKTRINEASSYEKELNVSKANVVVLRKELQRVTKVNEELSRKVDEAAKAEKALADTKRKMSRMKSEQSSIVESLRREIEAANKVQEDSKSSYHNDIEAMKESHTKVVSFYKEEIAELKEQLKLAMEIGDSDRSGAKEIERQLADCKRDNMKLKKQLQMKQTQHDINGADRVKEVKLLESELDKAHKVKADVENELNETKRQLTSALCNLNEMTLDGGKLQSDVERMMADHCVEKENLYSEIAALKRSRDDQMALVDELRREKIAVDIDGNTLQQNVRDLEMKLRGAEKFNDDLENEVKVLKGRLDKSAGQGHAITDMNLNQRLRLENASLQDQLESSNKSKADLRQTNRDISLKLSKAQQTIHKLQSKERYLESRVDSLSNQISKTVRDYEMKLVSIERMPPPPPPPLS
jgi:chromosome segregation ATPase